MHSYTYVKKYVRRLFARFSTYRQVNDDTLARACVTPHDELGTLSSVHSLGHVRVCASVHHTADRFGCLTSHMNNRVLLV